MCLCVCVCVCVRAVLGSMCQLLVERHRIKCTRITFSPLFFPRYALSSTGKVYKNDERVAENFSPGSIIAAGGGSWYVGSGKGDVYKDDSKVREREGEGERERERERKRKRKRKREII